MNNPFSIGDTKTFLHIVTLDDVARFPTGEVHAVYSTFALARDAEWAGRLFVLEIKEEDEEGIGTAVNIVHQSPALVGELVAITATLTGVTRNEFVTSFVANTGSRMIATGETRQKILKKERLKVLFEGLK